MFALWIILVGCEAALDFCHVRQTVAELEMGCSVELVWLLSGRRHGKDGQIHTASQVATCCCTLERPHVQRDYTCRATSINNKYETFGRLGETHGCKYKLMLWDSHC